MEDSTVISQSQQQSIRDFNELFYEKTIGDIDNAGMVYMGCYPRKSQSSLTPGNVLQLPYEFSINSHPPFTLLRCIILGWPTCRSPWDSEFYCLE